MTQLLTVGVIGKSSKENEKRLAIHPEHIKGISQRLRKQITFEEGYGVRFGMNDNMLAELTSGRVACREESARAYLSAECQASRRVARDSRRFSDSSHGIRAAYASRSSYQTQPV